jgi:CheY-like chemotaxis protein
MARNPPPASTDQRPADTDGDAAPPGFRVFVLEDDADLVDVIEAWLHRQYGESVTVHTAHTLAEAETELEDLVTIDFAIIDRKLPDGHGDELLDSLIDRFDPILVMITGTVPGPDLIGLPIHDYLVKPVDEAELLNGLSLLEKLEAANALSAYSDARKASLLEYHLEDPDSNPLFRRFAARWEYDRLEVATYGDTAVVYELYIGRPGGESDPETAAVQLSVTGGLDAEVADLLAEGVLAAEGELVPSGGDDYAWVKHSPEDLIDTSDGAIGIYRFTCPVPEQYVADLESRPAEVSLTDLMAVLEAEYN